MRNALVVLVILSLATLACGQAEPRHLNLYPTETVELPSTPLVVLITTTPNATQTPKVITVPVTPDEVGELCVSASEAVYLRPSPNDKTYPITVIPNGTRLTDLGGRNGKWVFVALGDKRGWVHGDYVVDCS